MGAAMRVSVKLTAIKRARTQRSYTQQQGFREISHGS